MYRKQSGFTLVEIAIVLVIIGLLLGGVLKGQELIQSAKIKNVIADFNGTTIAYYGYRDRYKAIPGDDKGASARWTSANPAPANGDGLGTLGGAFDATSGESFDFWHHLRLAGFVGGSGSGGPENAYAGKLGVQDGADSFHVVAGDGFKGVIICASKIADKGAAAIDNQLDDGNPNTGIVRAIKEGTTALVIDKDLALTAGTVYEETGNITYTMCKSL